MSSRGISVGSRYKSSDGLREDTRPGASALVGTILWICYFPLESPLAIFGFGGASFAFLAHLGFSSAPHMTCSYTCPSTHPRSLSFCSNHGQSQHQKKQERIEEEKYIRQKEHEDYLKRRAEQVDEEAAKARDEAQKAHDDAMHDTIDELFGVLAKTGDKISDIGVENLALWKLGKK